MTERVSKQVDKIEYKKAMLWQRWPRNAPKIFGTPCMMTTPMATFPEIFHGLLLVCSNRPCEYAYKILSPYSFFPSSDNRGAKNWADHATPWIRRTPTLSSPKLVNWFLFGWILFMHELPLPNLKSVRLLYIGQPRISVKNAQNIRLNYFNQCNWHWPLQRTSGRGTRDDIPIFQLIVK